MKIRTLTPQLAAALAADVYETLEMPAGAAFKPVHEGLKANFDFSSQAGVIHGRSGGFFFRRNSGYAVVGKGKTGERYDNHIVIAFRGTQTGADWVSNSNTQTVTIENQTQVHKGFYEIFKSIRPTLEQQLNPLLRGRSHLIVHCSGHSLGAALAQLAAIWIRKFYGNHVALYTFGAPRVGVQNFAIKASNCLDANFRCIHGEDPVPLIPVWPYYHAPYNGLVVRLTADTGIRVASHAMRGKGHTYLNSAQGEWATLISRERLPEKVYLKYGEQHKVTFSKYWQEQIQAAITTVLRDTGVASASVLALQSIGGGLNSFYDIVAMELENAAKTFPNDEHVKGLLAHMLVFAGRAAHFVIKLNAHFIRWVFSLVLSTLERAARSAVNGIR